MNVSRPIVTFHTCTFLCTVYQFFLSGVEQLGTSALDHTFSPVQQLCHPPAKVSVIAHQHVSNLTHSHTLEVNFKHNKQYSHQKDNNYGYDLLVHLVG